MGEGGVPPPFFLGRGGPSLGAWNFFFKSTVQFLSTESESDVLNVVQVSGSANKLSHQIKGGRRLPFQFCSWTRLQRNAPDDEAAGRGNETLLWGQMLSYPRVEGLGVG